LIEPTKNALAVSQILIGLGFLGLAVKLFFQHHE